MLKPELIEKLKAIAMSAHKDSEGAHIRADAALLEFIADKEVDDAFAAVEKYYA